MERLGNSHFAPINVPIMTAVTSLIVQGYFCYRIWALNGWSWICWTIAVVCIPDPPCGLRVPDVFLNTECACSINRGDVGGRHSQYTLYQNVTSYLTQRLVTHGWQVCGVQGSSLCTHIFLSNWTSTSYFVVLVMVNTEFRGGHSDRGGNDSARTGSPHRTLHIDRDPFAQLRRASGNFSSFVLIRVVRLTIETNALTGTYFSETAHGRASNFFFSQFGYLITCTLCRLSRESNRDRARSIF